VFDGVSTGLLGGLISDLVSVTVGFGRALSGEGLIGTVSVGVGVTMGIGVHVGVGISVGDGVIVVTLDVTRDVHETVQVMKTNTTVAATLRVTKNETCFTQLGVHLL
jgi:hypothetical protein